MRNQLFAVTFILFACMPVLAQQRYTDQLRRQTEGQGKITLYQSEKITALVNGTVPKASVPRTPVSVPSTDTRNQRQQPESMDAGISSNRSTEPRMRVNGFRIQVYSGDNSRKGKNEATAMGRRAKDMFPELTVYTNFASPHWICRVGDFRTYEEASEYLRQMREPGMFAEAVIVRCKVYVQI